MATLCTSLLLLFLLSAIHASGQGSIGDVYDVEYDNTPGNSVRLRIVFAETLCPGTNVFSALLASGQRASASAIGSPMTDGLESRWTLQMLRPGNYRVCVCSSSCSDASSFDSDAGTFTVAGPYLAIPSYDGYVASSGGSAASLGNSVNLSLVGEDLQATNQILGVPADFTCGQESRRYKAATGSAFGGGQVLLRDPEVIDGTTNRVLRSDYVLTEEFKVTFLITPRTQASFVNLDLFELWESTAVEAFNNYPIRRLTSDPFLLNPMLRVQMASQELKVELECGNSITLGGPGGPCTQLACNLGLTVGQQTSVSIQFIDGLLLVNGNNVTCAASQQHPSQVGQVTLGALAPAGSSGTAEIADLTFRSTLATGLATTPIEDMFASLDTQTWYSTGQVTAGSGQVVMGGSGGSSLTSRNRFSRGYQIKIQADINMPSDCGDHRFSLSLSSSFDQASTVVFGYWCTSKRVRYPGNSVQTNCTNMAASRSVTITLQPDGSGVFVDNSCDPLVLDSIWGGFTNERVYLRLGARSDAVFTNVVVTVSAPLLLAGLVSTNGNGFEVPRLEPDLMHTGSTALRACWCDVPVNETTLGTVDEVIVQAPMTTTTSTITTETTTTTAGSNISVVSGFRYDLAGVLGEVHPTSDTTAVPWKLELWVKWSTDTNYVIRAHKLQDPSSGDIYDLTSGVGDGSTNTMSLYDSSVDLTSAAVDPYRYVSLVDGDGILTGTVNLGDYNWYLPLPKVSVSTSFSDTDLRQNYIAGNVSWTTWSSSVTGFSLWASQDIYGIRRTSLLSSNDRATHCTVPPSSNKFEVAPFLVGEARYILIYSCNEAGEQHEGAVVPLVDRYRDYFTSCTSFADFQHEAAAVTVGTWDRYLEIGNTGARLSLVAAGSFPLTIQGPTVTPTESFSVVYANTSCDGLQLDSVIPQFTISTLSYANRTYNMTLQEAGSYRLCACYLADGCDYRSVTPAVVDSFTVSTVAATIATEGQLIQGAFFDVEVSGSSLTALDRIRVVPLGQCGVSAPTSDILFNADILNGQGNVSSGPDGLVLTWYGLQAFPGNYSVCWCGGLGDECSTDEVFLGEAATFTVGTTTATTSTTTSTTTSMTTSTTSSSTTSVTTTNTSTATTTTTETITVTRTTTTTSTVTTSITTTLTTTASTTTTTTSSVTTTNTTTTTSSTTTTTPLPCTTAIRPANSPDIQSHCVPREHGETCEVLSCNAGFEVAGLLQCNNGQFIEPSPACARRPCAPPVDELVPILLPDGSLLGSSDPRADLQLLNCTGMVFEDECQAVCSEGYVLDVPGGSSNLICNQDGNFTGNTTCVRNEEAVIYRCSVVPAFTGVQTEQGCGDLFHGQSCGLLCPSGYTLSGPSGLVCDFGTLVLTAGGTPQCEAAACTEPPVVLEGGEHLNCSGLPHDAYCVPQCDEGRRFVSGDIRCRFGSFVVSGRCLEIFVADVVEAQAANAGQVVQNLFTVAEGATMVLDILVDGASATAGFNYAWAIQNLQLILNVLSTLINILPRHLGVELLPIFNNRGSSGQRLLGTSRRLQTNETDGSFQMRMRFLLPAFTTTTTTGLNQQVPLQTSESVFLQQLLASLLELVRVSGGRFNTTGSGSSGSNNNNPTGDYYVPSLFLGFAEELQATGQPIPQAWNNGSLTAPVDPVYVPDASFLTPFWILDPWGSCSCDGGPAVQRRTIHCTVDHLASCDNGTARPPVQQNCECPEPIPWLGIPDDVKIAVGSGGLVGLFCLCFCMYELRRFFRSTKGGRAKMVDNNKVTVKYTVQDGHKTSTSDGKVHVVWDVTSKDMEMLLAGQGGEERNPQMELEVGLPRTLSEELALSSPREHDHHQRRAAALAAACPMYQDGEVIEYFSKTHSCWLPGIVKVKLDREVHNGPPRAVYDVHITRSNQWRTSVTLDVIRQPLAQADPVDVWSKRDGGSWHPGAVYGVQVSGATSLGYRVQLEEGSLTRATTPSTNFGDESAATSRYSSPVSRSSRQSSVAGGGMVLDKVPGVRLRRRFPAGCPVEVYRGPPNGWVPAVVADELPSRALDRHPRPLSRFSPGSAPARDSSPPAPVSGSGRGGDMGNNGIASLTASGMASPTASQTLGSVLGSTTGSVDVFSFARSQAAGRAAEGAWTLVPVQEDSGEDSEMHYQPTEVVASYLLRLRTVYVLRNPNREQDTLMLL